MPSTNIIKSVVDVLSLGFTSNILEYDYWGEWSNVGIRLSIVREYEVLYQYGGLESLSLNLVEHRRLSMRMGRLFYYLWLLGMFLSLGLLLWGLLWGLLGLGLLLGLLWGLLCKLLWELLGGLLCKLLGGLLWGLL